MVRLTDRPAMTIAVDLGRKATKPTNNLFTYFHIAFKTDPVYLFKGGPVDTCPIYLFSRGAFKTDLVYLLYVDLLKLIIFIYFHVD